ncbi:helix-turn-helix domain-containing protein [Lachnoclostridium phytofermentans]|uniref:helix-turn-helix domain-containing protein n=1 Tax=Lachnoclostridium phytofermentans TaxID=66219 RepID=UPI000498565C|nr:helix-turn-helix transcriptional regulator [Lachnoclostridium phytofermentans]
MFDRLKFLGKIKECGKTVQEVASFLGINPATLYRKMNGESDFYREEIQKLKEFLNLKDPMEIFFAEKVTETQKAG